MVEKNNNILCVANILERLSPYVNVAKDREKMAESRDVIFLEKLFRHAMESDEDIIIPDGATANKWIHGERPLPKRIINHYMENENGLKYLANDIATEILPNMPEKDVFINKLLHNLISNDPTLAQEKKEELLSYESVQADAAAALFIAKVMLEAMSRTYLINNKLFLKMVRDGDYSILPQERYIGKIPKPCAYFQGRKTELTAMHDLINNNKMICLEGIPGIGKSELAKMYAKKYSKEYNAVIFMQHTGDLKQDIANLLFRNELELDYEKRFDKHDNFLKCLGEDVLLVVDNYNIIRTNNSDFTILQNYKCHIIITTRCHYEEIPSIIIESLSPISQLVNLVEFFYKPKESELIWIRKIIKLLYQHTYAVELVARLLKYSRWTPAKLYVHLLLDRLNTKIKDKIKTEKDNAYEAATFYAILHKLYSLFLLNAEERGVLRDFCFMPKKGIMKSEFADLTNLETYNEINDLIEKGFIQQDDEDELSMHLMAREVALKELDFNFSACEILYKNIYCACVNQDKLDDSQCIFTIADNLSIMTQKDTAQIYLRFAEDIFERMDEYAYRRGMVLIIDQIEQIILNEKEHTFRDEALLLDFKATINMDPTEKVRMEQEALHLLENAEDKDKNIECIANLENNLGAYYRLQGDYVLSEEHLTKAIEIFEKCEGGNREAIIARKCNLAVTYADAGKKELCLQTLREIQDYLTRYQYQISNETAVKTLNTMGNLALVFGDNTTAIESYARLLLIAEKAYGSHNQRIKKMKSEIKKELEKRGLAQDFEEKYLAIRTIVK